MGPVVAPPESNATETKNSSTNDATVKRRITEIASDNFSDKFSMLLRKAKATKRPTPMLMLSVSVLTSIRGLI